MFGKNKVEKLKEEIDELKKKIAVLKSENDWLKEKLKVEVEYDVVSNGKKQRVIADRIRRSFHHGGVSFYRGESEVAFFPSIEFYAVIDKQDK